MSITIPSKKPKVELRKLEQLGNGYMCSEKPPLLQINLENIIPDELHLMLRITDVLIEAVIHTAAQYDLLKQHLQRSRQHHKLNGAMLRQVMAMINGCGVKFNIWEDKTTKQLNWTSLVGGDKKSFSIAFRRNL